MTRSSETTLVLGGSGLVGYQVALRVARELRPGRIVLVALHRREVRDAIERLRRLVPGVPFDGYYGDLFGRGDPVHCETHVREDRLYGDRESRERREEIFRDTFVDFEEAFRHSMLVRLVQTTRPAVIVDCVNTATAISYQDVHTVSRRLMRAIGAASAPPAGESDKHEGTVSDAATVADLAETLVSSQSTPQLIFHLRLLERVFREVPTRVYVKVGTTGTGGMGLNIPYTHGEDRPSPTLMTKTAIGFAHTGLLFLLARTPGMPIVKEIKPAAMIGYRAIALKTIRGRVYKRRSARGGASLVPSANEPLVMMRAVEEPLDGRLDTTPRLDLTPVADASGRPRRLELPCVDTGENGLFTRGEFEAITSSGQMEYVTPEEIADLVVLEIKGASTGKDVIGAVHSSVLGPSYRAGMIRPVGLREVEQLERDSGVPSIAIGRLGPPQLAKLLYEAHLLATAYGTIDRVLGEDGDAPTAEEMAETLRRGAEETGVSDMAATLGIPLLLPDGRTLLRGPMLRMPEYDPAAPVAELPPERLEFFADRAWIDLRPANMRRWIERCRRIRRSAYSRRTGWASEHLTREGYAYEEIRIGAVVAWIFANEMGGYRIT